MMRIRVVVLAAVVACGNGSAAPDAGVDARLEGFAGPDVVCPGSPACETTGDGVLRVGAAKRIYTPIDFETYTDENNDNEYQTTEPYTDKNGNGTFDGVWLFGGGRAAKGVTSDIEVRAMAFIEGDVSVVIAYIDSIGMLSSDFDVIRADPRVAALGIDHVLLGTTHGHETPDMIGLWGPTVGVTGRQMFVIDRLVNAAAEAIVEAYDGAQPAQLQVASTKLINDPSSATSLTDDYNKDIRDPIIMDPTLTIARFVKASAPTETIGTLVNWGNHPEVARSDAALAGNITAHYPGYLRTAIENGLSPADSFYAQPALAGLGGVCMFVQGALGGQIGSLHNTHPKEPDGTPYNVESDHMEQLLGRNAAARALIALRDTGETTSVLPLAVKSAKFAARLDNTLFHVAVLVGIFGDSDNLLIGYDKDKTIEEGNYPWLPLRSTFVQIGPIGIVSAPGELHPELWVGGYDGSWSWGWPLYDNTKPNPPRFDEAPPPPYMRDLVLAHDGVKYPILAGSAESYIGYLVPAYNYDLHPINPYLKEAEGDHYEETVSVGPLVEQHAVHPILELLRYR
jgi:hypothetical protein